MKTVGRDIMSASRGVFCAVRVSAGLSQRYLYALAVATLLMTASGMAFSAAAPVFSPMPQSGQTAPLSVTIFADCTATAGVTYTCSCDDGSNTCTNDCPLFPATGSIGSCGSAQVHFSKSATM